MSYTREGGRDGARRNSGAVGTLGVRRVVFALYVISAVTVFPAALLMIVGLVIRLQAP